MPHAANEELTKMLTWVQAHDEALTRAREDYPPAQEDPNGTASALFALWKVQAEQLAQAQAQVHALQRELDVLRAQKSLAPSSPSSPSLPSLQALLCAEERKALRQVHLNLEELETRSAPAPAQAATTLT